MGDDERPTLARRDGSGRNFDSAKEEASTEPPEFWPAVRDHVLAQPRPLLGAVVATAVSVAVIVGAAGSVGGPALAGESGVSGDGAGHSATPADPKTLPTPLPPLSSLPSTPAPSRRERYRLLAEEAAKTCPGLPAGVLFAISAVESDHGRDRRVSRAGARGPMQFLPATWRAYAVDGDGDGRRDITNSADAVHTAARHLCANGGADPRRLRRAVWNYNHSKSYVDRVLSLAEAY